MSTTPLSGLAVSTHDLRKTFRHGANVAVAGLDLAVPRGGVHALLGPNGSGKTTALRMLLGLLRPDSGTMEVLGHTVPDELRNQLGLAVGKRTYAAYREVLESDRAMRLRNEGAKAQRLLEWLATDGQQAFVGGNHEYPVNPEVKPDDVVAGFGEFEAMPLDAEAYGSLNAEAVDLLA